MVTTSDRPAVHFIISGRTASLGTGKGRAVVLRDPHDVWLVRGGDVLVLRTADPAFAPALRLACAVVVEAGSILGSLPTIARELGVPMLLGVTQATTRIAGGDLVSVDVSVDGASGTVVVRPASR